MLSRHTDSTEITNMNGRTRMTTNIHRLFLNLVRRGIGNDNLNVNLDIDRVEDWEAVLALAERQGLSAVVADGIESLPKEARPPKPVILKLIGPVLQNYEYRHKLYRRAIAELAGFYNNHGFKMMVLKGFACALDWPKPEHRPSGDIDIWLFNQQKAADKELASSFRAQDSKFEIDNSHHHHTVFYWRDFIVENHYDFINVHASRLNARLEKIFKELGDASHLIDNEHDNEGTRIPWVEEYGERVYLPSANLHGLFLIRHAVAHFAAAEITLRQVLDWAFFVEKHGNIVDWPWLTDVLEEFGLRRFFDVLNAICVEDLGFKFAGLKASGLPRTDVDEALKARVLGDILEPEFSEEQPKRLLPRVWFRYRRWQANGWKQRLCYNESRWSTFWSGVWNHLLKPSSI